MTKQPIHGRAIVSLSMLAGFLIVSISGVLLYFAPPGRMAQELGWSFWGLTKGNWHDLHIVFGFVFILGGLIHLVLNMKPMAGYIYKKAVAQPEHERRFRWRFEGLLVLLFAFLLCLSTVQNTPPARYLDDLRQILMQQWQSGSGSGGGMGLGRGPAH